VFLPVGANNCCGDLCVLIGGAMGRGQTVNGTKSIEQARFTFLSFLDKK
jgi:hypothetical protein